MKYTKPQQIQYQKDKLAYHVRRLLDLGISQKDIIALIKPIQKTQ